MIARLVPLFVVAACLAACESPPSPPPQETGPPPELQRLLDESAVTNIAASLDDAVDRKDWPAALALFDEEIDVDFSSLGGAPGRIAKSGLIENWKAALTPDKQSFHLGGDGVATITGDAATLMTHGYAWNRLTTRTRNDLWEVWGVYQYKFVRTPQGWKINALKFVKTYERGDPDVRTATQ
jgi:hypothetical protein